MKICNFFGFGLYGPQFPERKFVHISQHIFSMPVDEQFPVLLLLLNLFHFLWCLPVWQLTVSHWDWFWERERWLASSRWSYFLLLPFRANSSVSRILSQQAAASAVAEVFLLVCALIEPLPINFVMHPVWIFWSLQCHCIAK